VTSKAGYWIGGGLIAFSVVGAILWGVTAFLRIDDTVDGFERVPIPGARTLALPAQKAISTSRVRAPTSSRPRSA
jgi:hypothetical protein